MMTGARKRVLCARQNWGVTAHPWAGPIGTVRWEVRRDRLRKTRDLERIPCGFERGLKSQRSRGTKLGTETHESPARVDLGGALMLVPISRRWPCGRGTR